MTKSMSVLRVRLHLVFSLLRSVIADEENGARWSCDAMNYTYTITQTTSHRKWRIHRIITWRAILAPRTRRFSFDRVDDSYVYEKLSSNVEDSRSCWCLLNAKRTKHECNLIQTSHSVLLLRIKSARLFLHFCAFTVNRCIQSGYCAEHCRLQYLVAGGSISKSSFYSCSWKGLAATGWWRYGGSLSAGRRDLATPSDLASVRSTSASVSQRLRGSEWQTDEHWSAPLNVVVCVTVGYKHHLGASNQRTYERTS